MATITKRICIPVGSYHKTGADKPTIQYREIGVVMEFRDQAGNTWQELQLHLDALSSTLASLASRQQDRNESNARAKLFDVTRKVKAPTPESEEEAPPMAEDEIPF